MAGLQRKLGGREGVRLVSFSVDPQHDTPKVLREYAARYGADPSRWLFLTGDWEAMRDLVFQGFKLAIERAGNEEVDVGELITHSDRLVLVDRLGRVRGYYRGTLEEGEEKLMDDLESVLGEL
jgi:protein SCO1/2